MSHPKLATMLEQAEQWPIEAQEEALAALEAIEEGLANNGLEGLPDRAEYLGLF